MKCIKCGEETGSDSLFCAQCLSQAAAEIPSGQLRSKKKKNGLIVFPLVMAVAVWLIAAVLFFASKDNGDFYKTTVVDTNDYWVEEGICFDSVYASSQLTDEYGTSYGAENLCDGNLETSWIEGKDDNGIGEFILFEAKENKAIRRIDIINGYQNTLGHFFRNSRIKKCSVEINDTKKFQIDFPDKFGKKVIVEFDSPIQTSSVRITVDEVYEGSHFKDTSITDIVFS